MKTNMATRLYTLFSEAKSNPKKTPTTTSNSKKQKGFFIRPDPVTNNVASEFSSYDPTESAFNIFSSIRNLRNRSQDI